MSKLPVIFLLFLLPQISFANDNVNRGGDYHLHIYSQNGTALLAALCEAMPQACDEQMKKGPPPLTAEDAIQVLDDAGLDRGVIMSTAYFSGAPELAGTPFDSAETLRAENQYIAGQVAKYPTRLVGLFSVNPLKAYAVEEVRYWAKKGGMAGLKLHFANSDVDFSNADHISRLREIFMILDENALPVAVHLRNRNPGYGAADADIFVNQVAANFPSVRIQFAHLAGWGAWDEGTNNALGAILNAISAGKLERSRVWFDVAAVVIKPLPDEALPQVAARIRQIGLDRVLFASDWNAMGTPGKHLQETKSRLALTEAEWNQIMSNEGPYSWNSGDSLPN